jgi:hypothetical protein
MVECEEELGEWGKRGDFNDIILLTGMNNNGMVIQGG